ncbi:AMP-dependent synthetase/ligase [Acidiluteibacter ferrifornacis]|uniref:AMP-binding protein n=1 Tax=Acidiluteibacter ferrifornacis TaxID=2692424 RepID=A0A6N9NKQ0_9FLAO|nr:long-chain fatty acid--CoA ligase [Acidiluteibacter ferrifornacis]MBR9831698.1 long-chain fatty acid--CoA ligase [bacterium]NBG66041.1 AMP-binding protein [Acidiluteibacter ferrifornacis]
MEKQLTRIFDLHYHQQNNYKKEDSLTSKVNGKWEKISTDEFISMGQKMSMAFLKMGLKPGDKIAIISNNRSEWHITDLGITQMGGISVPIYPTITEDDYAYIMNDAEIKCCFVSDADLFQKVSNIKSQVPSLESVYTFDQVTGAKNWKEVLELDANGDFSAVQTIMDGIQTEDLATLIYTSGTTGRPKGVMLSHKNLVSNSLSSRKRLPCDHNSRALSFLPLCHVYERMVAYMYIYVGVSIYYAESMETIGDDLKDVKPQIFTAVPRLLEKVYDKIMAKGMELTGIKRALFFWAVGLGQRYEIEGNNPFFNFQLKLANKIIFSKWREALGGNALAVASGAAALQPRLARIFLAAQIPVMEGYGLTETSPVISVNCEENNGVRIGTVGRPLDDVTVKIAEDGEILVKGPNVMMGYYKKPEATAEVFTEDGFFKTGDIGELSADNFLKITGRKKETFKTSGGKYIAPQVIENKMKESSFIEQLMVVGEGEKHPSAVIQPAFDFLKDYCKRKNIPFTDNASIVKNQRIIDRIQKEVDFYNEGFAKYEQVKRFILVPDVWGIDSGEMTPTMKIKRAVVKAKYLDQIEAIYR